MELVEQYLIPLIAVMFVPLLLVVVMFFIPVVIGPFLSARQQQYMTVVMNKLLRMATIVRPRLPRRKERKNK